MRTCSVVLTAFIIERMGIIDSTPFCTILGDVLHFYKKNSEYGERQRHRFVVTTSLIILANVAHLK